MLYSKHCWWHLHRSDHWWFLDNNKINRIIITTHSALASWVLSTSWWVFWIGLWQAYFSRSIDHQRHHQLYQNDIPSSYSYPSEFRFSTAKWPCFDAMPLLRFQTPATSTLYITIHDNWGSWSWFHRSPQHELFSLLPYLLPPDRRQLCLDSDECCSGSK